MKRQVSGLCPGSQKTFCSVEVGNSGEKKISNFQCVVVIVVPELSVKGCTRQEDLRMLGCLGVDVKARGRQSCGTLEAEVLDSWSSAGPGWGGLSTDRCGLTQGSFLRRTCPAGMETRGPPVEAGDRMPLSAGSQGSYTGRQWVRARGICVTI